MRLLKLASKIASISFAASVLIGAAPPAAPMREGRPLVVAHRGGAASRPENTFSAFDHAVRLGADWLEFDMEMTGDDQLVIQHDGTVPAFCRARSGSGPTGKPVREMTLAQLQRFDCGSRHRDSYPCQKAVSGARMPTPDALFARYKRAGVTFYGEAKMPGVGEGDVNPVQFTKLIEAAVRKHGLEDRFVLQSADYRTIDAMHAINPRIRTCLLLPWRFGTDFLALARKHHATCMLLRLANADVVQVKALQEAGITIVSEVIDDEASWQDYIARGDDAIFTNDPAGLIAFLKRSGSER